MSNDAEFINELKQAGMLPTEPKQISTGHGGSSFRKRNKAEFKRRKKQARKNNKRKK